MVRRLVLLLLLVFLSASALHSQQQDQDPVLEGYVTRVTSLTDFDVNGYHVVLRPETLMLVKFNSYQSHRPTTPPPLGQAASITGVLKKKQHEVVADSIFFHVPDTSPRSGIAIVDRVLRPARPGNPSGLLLRADGYVILINPTVKITFASPLKSATDVTEGIWIQYHGKPQSDGILLADSAEFSPNTVSDEEARLLDKNDYDPAAVDPKSKQSTASKLFLGINPKKIPPHIDPAMQSRISQIGAKLIPAFQRNLADTDDTKILFKFQLIDTPKWKDAITLPNGIILVPYQLINRLQNDSQIAAVLADNIATALEKQNYRMIPAAHELLGTNIAGTAAGLFVPGLGLVTSVATASAAKKLQSNLLNQTGRVSLGLLHDAGYDIDQAPIAWRILSKGSAADLTASNMPPRAANLYQSLSSTWRNYSDPPASPLKTLETKPSADTPLTTPNPAKTQ